jgi:hypothetical protein
MDRTHAEIKAAAEEFYARRWYLVSLAMAAEGRDSAEAEEARQRMALENPVFASDLEQLSDLHTGWLLGAHQALRWVLGDGDRIEDASRDT